MAIHLICAAVFAGGLVFLGVTTGVARKTLPPRTRIEFFRLVGRRFTILGSVALAILVATGIYLAERRLSGLDELLNTGWGRTLSVKLALVLLVIALTFVHAAIQGPRLRHLRVKELTNPNDLELARMIRKRQTGSGLVSGFLLVATVAILVLGVRL